MQYAVLIYENTEGWATLGDDERKQMTDRYWTLRGEPGVLGGAGLQRADTATTVRVQGGETLVTDGPFADTKEVFGGYYLLEADDIDSAIAFAAKLPAAELGGAIEIRPVVERST
jgi:hypothetical protein